MSEWVNVIKNCAIEAVEANKPTKVEFGKVIGLHPLKIEIGQKLTLTNDFLVLTDKAKTASLSINDAVLLLQMQGGQTFVVVDKL